MVLLIDGIVFLLLLLGAYMSVSWLWESGVQEIMIYTEQFLLEETRKVRINTVPDINSTKWRDKLELSLYYSGIRNYFPFISGRVWILFCTMLVGCICISVYLWRESFLQACLVSAVVWFLLRQLLEMMRCINLRATEKYLLEFLNVTESFAVTGEEPAAILSDCSAYIRGPIGQALKGVDKYLNQGWSGRMILEQLMIMLEHPKWQEFIHNMNVCSMYNSEYSFVFRSSRKSIQFYLSNKKERHTIKHTAQIEMGIIICLCIVIVWALSNFLMLPVGKLMWGSPISKSCTIYMVGIIWLFYMKIGRYEKE